MANVLPIVPVKSNIVRLENGSNSLILYIKKTTEPHRTTTNGVSTLKNIYFIIGSLSGALAVAMGAYGAHAGAQFFTPETMVTFGKAVRYNMHHALVLLVVTLAINQWPQRKKLLHAAGVLFIAGIILFSGSVYLLALTGISLGYITPLGGVSFICGWLCLAMAAWKKNDSLQCEPL